MSYSKRSILYDNVFKSQSQEYCIYRNIINRCSPGYAESVYYADKGIGICERWKHSFDNFFKDMGRRPSPEHSIDRIDNAKGYTPSNCRWATKRQQSLNRSYVSSSGYRGVSWFKPTKKWKVGIDKITLGYFFDKEEAALAYDCAAIQLHGSDARLNILEQSLCL